METADQQRILDKVRKLLALAKSTGSIGNVQEAAAAAGKAQELIERYNIEAAMLFADNPQETAAAIIQKVIFNRPEGKGRVPTWILNLAGGIAEANRIYIWYHASNDRGDITAAGTVENIDKAETLLTWLMEEVSRLYEEEKPDDLARGEGKRWSNSFRLGAVSTISKRLKEAVQAAQKALKCGPSEQDYKLAIQSGDPQKVLELDSQKYGIAKVDAALARLDQDYTRTVAWVKETQKLNKGTARRCHGHAEAYSAGVQAGHRANIQP